jgi:hypothetical protein
MLIELIWIFCFSYSLLKIFVKENEDLVGLIWISSFIVNEMGWSILNWEQNDMVKSLTPGVWTISFVNYLIGEGSFGLMGKQFNKLK